MTPEEIITALDGWLERRESFFPVETAESALEVLKRMPAPIMVMPRESLRMTIRALEAWLGSEESEIPLETCRAVLHWVRQSQGKTP